MHRRQFVKTSALSALAAAAPPAFFSEKNEPLTLGQGKKKYRLDTRWASADATRCPVNDCHEMAQDRLGRVLLLTNDTRNNLIFFDKNGRFLKSWGREYPGAHGLTLFDEGGEDVLFITDYERHRVFKTTIDGRVLLEIGLPKEIADYKTADQFKPTETAIGPNGDIYVADGYGLDFIIQFDAKGRYVRHFGGRGTGPGNLKNAHGICLDHRGGDPSPILLATSREENCFKRFDLAGNHLSTIELPGAWVCRAVVRGGFLYAAVLQSESRPWQSSGFVTILDEKDRVVSNLAGSEPGPSGRPPSEFYQTIKAFEYPHDVLVDDEENLYVCQWNSGRKHPFKLTPVA